MLKALKACFAIISPVLGLLSMGIKRGGRKSPRQEEVARGVVVRLEEGAGHWRNGTAHVSPARNKVTVQLRR